MGVRRFGEPYCHTNHSSLPEGMTYVNEYQIKQISDDINIVKKQTIQTASTTEKIYDMVANLCKYIVEFMERFI